MLMRLHWWCMKMGKRFDRPGYSKRSWFFDTVGGYATRLSRVCGG